MGYKLFIDESGDEGIDKNNLKQTQLFFFGAFLIKEENISHVQNVLNRCEKTLGKKIHSTSLKHEQKVFLSHEIVKMPIRCFGLISDKKGLDRGNYREKITGQKGFFYNKNVHYLLETVGKFSKEASIELDSIIFDKIDSKDYGRLRRYLDTVKNSPQHENAKHLKKIDPSKIIARTHQEEPLLKIADSISNFLYRSCIKDKFGYTERRYLETIKDIFMHDQNGLIASHGIQAVPRGWNNLSLQLSDLDFLQNLKNSKDVFNHGSLEKIA